KYFNPEIAREYKKIELAAEQRLLAMLPPELIEDFRPLLDSRVQSGTPYEELARLVKDADTLCAYTKCLEEINAGNREFEPARKRLEAMLEARMSEEMRYFIDTFVASFSLPLDELNAH
ncbi:MAG: 5'-deoxynucleotidase, partial [Aeromonas sobria]